MAEPQRRPPQHTLQDYLTWEGRWELIRGQAYNMAAAPNTLHQRLSFRLELAIHEALESAKKSRGGSCEIFHSPYDVYLSEDTVVQPDILIVCDPAKIRERGCEGAPDLVVEILSPSTALKDMNHKRWIYEEFAVPEYLIVDPMSGTAEVLLLDDTCRYRSLQRLRATGELQVLQGKLPITLELPAPQAGSDPLKTQPIVG